MAQNREILAAENRNKELQAQVLAELKLSFARSTMGKMTEELNRMQQLRRNRVLLTHYQPGIHEVTDHKMAIEELKKLRK